MKFIKKLFTKKAKVPDSPAAPAPTLFVCGSCADSVLKAYRHCWDYSLRCEACWESELETLVNEQLADLGEEGEWYATQELVWEYYQNEWQEVEVPKDYSNEPQVWGFIIEHPRMGYDRVYFGPFRTREELNEWMNNVGRKHHVTGAVYPIMNPYGDPADFWWIPNDMPWDETLKPKKDREYIP